MEMAIFDDVAVYLVLAPLLIVLAAGLGVAIWALRAQRVSS